jgi:hypothetical protein
MTPPVPRRLEKAQALAAGRLGGGVALAVIGARTPEQLKEIKVTIPAELHLRLVQEKILHGQPIGTSVSEALRIYFGEA